MQILVTGAAGFLGKNLVYALENIRDGKDKTRGISPDITILPFDLDTPPEVLNEYCQKADFVYNLAGINRPEKEEDFMEGNFSFGETLLKTLEKHGNKCPVMLSSSIQATLDNPYGRSKKAGEDLFFSYAARTGAKAYVFRFPNLFGKWCRPNYNSAVATFCHNMARDLPITVNDRSHKMHLAYIDDVVDALLGLLEGKAEYDGDYCIVPTTYHTTLGEIVEIIEACKECRKSLYVPNMQGLSMKLYATYLSYIPPEKMAYPLTKHTDDRGSFTEIIRTLERGQFSVNVSKPGITKGNHWHHTKNEKFMVVSGKGVIRLRKIGEEKVHEFFVSGEKHEIVDILPGYTHNIENVGEGDLVTFMWANECFDPTRPDTFFEEV
ncbi:MAG: NAD-dependent epimerase/dehydratase family protein [Clostridia bacterium]|nr:NAD-dependent epimerase/dehydratase family protein [Clostridia bacterium]